MRRLGAILLAAGCSSRFGRDNKLLAKINGQPMVRVVADALFGASCIDEVLVVTGHDAPAVEGTLDGLKVRFIFNADWRDGMGGSIALGVSKLAAALDGAAIVPGDMPFLTSSVIDRLGAKFQEYDGTSIVFPATPAGEQRNPVIWPRRFFGLLEDLTGPEGGKRLLIELADSSCPVLIPDERLLLDIDAPDDMPDASKDSQPQAPS
ncbi:MAG: nucleotidyltransferase family protein [Methyloceanibacter sp.]|uniref:nucleotidyltransferase family protein n=1 Tax=Methyloceanibacter sp. TaxID=1965321 RepID=UPI003D6D7D6C